MTSCSIIKHRPGCREMATKYASGLIRALFSRHVELRAVIDAALEGRVGSVEADPDGRVARLSVGCYEFFGGDPALPAARGLIEAAVAPHELIYANDPAWRRQILEVHGPRVSDRPMRTFDPSRLSAASLRRMEHALPDCFELRSFDAALARQLDRELEPHALQVYRDADAFVTDGIGYAVVNDGRVACAATSY